MHTAMRLALAVCQEIRVRRPDVPICLYGLYAGLDAGRLETSTENLVDVTIAGQVSSCNCQRAAILQVEWIRDWLSERAGTASEKYHHRFARPVIACV